MGLRPTHDGRKVSGAGVPARQAVRTGWKACATGRKQYYSACSLMMRPWLVNENP